MLKWSWDQPTRGSGADRQPDAPPEAPVEDAPRLSFYSKWAKPPYPPSWGKLDLLDYARKQVENGRYYLAQAEQDLQHVVGHPIQAFPGNVDGALQAYDEGMVTLLEAVRFGATREEVAPILEELRPILQNLPTLIARGMSRAAELGFQLGFDEGWYQGWSAGYEARKEDEDSFWQWAKKAAAVGVGVGIALVGIVLALALSNVAKR